MAALSVGEQLCMLFVFSVGGKKKKHIVSAQRAAPVYDHCAPCVLMCAYVTVKSRSSN